MEKNRADIVTARLVLMLKEERLKLKISHQTLAALAGVDRSTVSLIEAGKRIPTIKICFKIAWALGLDLGDIIQKAQKDRTE